MSVAQHIIDMNNVRTNKNHLVSYLYSYLKEDILMHMYFLCIHTSPNYLTNISNDLTFGSTAALVKIDRWFMIQFSVNRL